MYRYSFSSLYGFNFLASETICTKFANDIGSATEILKLVRLRYKKQGTHRSFLASHSFARDRIRRY